MVLRGARGHVTPFDRVWERMLRLPPATTRDVVVQRDLAVPLRAGVTLLADRYAPAHDPRAPLVLLRTPYGRRGAIAGLLGWGRPTAERGFPTLVVSTRGTGGSGGELDPMAERSDRLDTIAWLRRQAWYPGRFATADPSYLGLTQWAIADAAPGEPVGTGDPVATATRGVRARHEVLHDAEHPSHVELPVMPLTPGR